MRAELFSADQMEQHGRTLANAHVIGRQGRADGLLRRLHANEQVLAEHSTHLAAAVKAGVRIVPAGEWLLDNFFLIEMQVRTARKHLPKAYSREIPRLAEGPSRGLPRVYDLALQAIAHGDGRVDADSLVRYLTAYQTVAPLSLGELWAVPIMLRLALIENLRRVSLRISADHRDRMAAQGWAERMMEVAECEPKDLILVIADMARSHPPLTSAFVAELSRRLQGHGPALALPLTWIEQRLAESSLTIAQLVHSENQQQAADQVSVSNTIGSLRFLGATDWHRFVEAVSLVERALWSDDEGPSSYQRMDFETRDQYRRVVARLARYGTHSEAEVAGIAVQMARDAAERGDPQLRQAHVGYYLVDQGLTELEKRVRFRAPMIQRLRKAGSAAPLAIHLGAMVLLTLLLTAGLLSTLGPSNPISGPFALLTALALLAASQPASVLVNWLSTLLTQPTRIPRLDYAKGIPEDMRTLCVIPCLLSSRANIAELLEALEVRFLGNRDAQLHFGLLTDFRDAIDARQPPDDALLRQARSGISALNRKYHPAGDDRFFLFHRPRLWNAADQIWMGYERKRGKLADLNAALLSGDFARFSLVIGRRSSLQNVRYVITLDSDTLLPRDSARQLIGAMSHPLNRPEFDTRHARVRAGYGVLQPRVATSLSGVERSRYAQMCGGESGIDPYTRSASDVYQDVFGEGSFIGKGIYDVAAFERALGRRFPDNRILSHDLLEGCYARSGLLSDVHLFEDYPARYADDMVRQERWIRGDWQIARWCLPRVVEQGGQWRANPLSALSRWKIIDNLRRSLVAPATLFALLLGWMLSPHSGVWTLALIGLSLLSPLLIAGVDLGRKPRGLHLREHLAVSLRSAGRGLAQAGFRLACLPYEAYVALRAIGRTLWRMSFTHRSLLEWRVAMGAGDHDAVSTISAYRQQWVGPLIALVMSAVLLARSDASSLAAAAPLLGLWLIGPWMGAGLSRPLRHRQETLDETQTLMLRRLARRTWAFFERFVCAEHHWLPPDNFQETPTPVTAHRTSPTNIGLALLANLAARDFGYLSAGGLLDRTRQCLDTLSRLARYQGHFYNWYDTLSLQPLTPRYVSAVDSGNLAGHLLTLRAGIEALPDEPFLSERTYDGLVDTLDVDPDATGEGPACLVERLRVILHEVSPDERRTLRGQHDWLHAVVACMQPATERTPAEGSAPTRCIDALARQARAALADLLDVMPWLSLPPAPPGYEVLVDCDAVPSLRQLVYRANQCLPQIEIRRAATSIAADKAWLQTLHAQMVIGRTRALARIAECAALAALASEFANQDYEFLYDRDRHLLAIGYNVDDSRRDSGFYDLLASEARLASFVAIAQGKLPQDSWWALGRLLTTTGGRPALLSWSGSMFEYLMPQLVMPSFEGSLLDQTCRAAVARQISYGDQRNLPWGVSESGYATVDANFNYQYRAFGVPGLGMKRGLASDLVVAPYASVLALMVAPLAACANLLKLSAAGLDGAYGYYEAIDYSPARLPPGQASVVLRSFMAHHQGMCLLALAHVLLDQPMQRRFSSAPLFRATLPLLQERIPSTSDFQPGAADHPEDSGPFDVPEASPAQALGAATASPDVQLMSNGRYHVMATNAGGGSSRWKDLAVTRWREDSTRDAWGTFLYLRDVGSGEVWSAAHQPTLKRADSYEAVFSEGRAEYRRRDHDIESHTTIVVSPEDDIEIRRLRLTHHGSRRRIIEVTSYAEVVLAAPAADATQPAFGNLFVQSEILAERRAILCTRRPRSDTDASPWMFHLLASNGSAVESPSYETDRMRFIGRGRSVADPAAMDSASVLSGSQGSVLDPIVSIRCRVSLEPGESITLDWIYGAADDRHACTALVDKYQDRHLADRVFDLAWTHAGVTLRQINATESDAYLYRRLASSVLYANPALRADPVLLAQNRRGQSGLWAYAISGDLPIVLLKIGDIGRLHIARQLIQCHAYWRLKGLAVDLVIWNEDHANYRQLLQDQIVALIAQGIEAQTIDRPGGIFVRSSEQISYEDRILLQSVARVILSDRNGTLAEQTLRRSIAEPRVARFTASRTHRDEPPAITEPPRPDLILANHLGGFSADGREYVITTTRGQRTPTPWANVLANAGFGTVITESGLGYSWSENAHEFRLTPWSDDPVGASGGEALYLRDEESGHYWSPTPYPVSGAMPYRCRHGFGYSVFEHTAGGIHSELCVYVDLEDAVKFSVLRIRNGSGRTRRLSATGYVEWVLGDLRSKTGMHVLTAIDPVSGALFASNAYSPEFADRIAFFDVDDSARTMTGDRTEFVGRNGSLFRPGGLGRSQLSGRLGAGLDPCGALQVPFELADGEEREIIFRLGAGEDLERTRALAKKLRKPGAARAALERVRAYWTHALGAVQIKTPDPALDVLANGWLIYQTLACRVWARSGYTQSGGAFGFRDQLQDTMALIHTEPRLLREHLLRSASRQFLEGDVQHWWHPPAGRGVRTRCSDDYLWLPLALCRYVTATGDTEILEQRVAFLDGRALVDHEESYYALPGATFETASLYEHARRAIEHGLRFGEHGLPLMGSGDWNDGMNLVGIEGRGESVWLAFFLYEVLASFAALANRHADPVFAARCREHATELQRNIEQHAWDGQWYRRAWFDDGSPLGSAQNTECAIDSIAQSWSVLSGAGDVERGRIAMASVNRHLVRRDAGLVQLLDPPFDRSTMNPGYIRGYVPGVRENGGQYTHAAIWAAMAFARQGDGVRAWDVLNLINPVNHARNEHGVSVYKTEPYVVAADVYAVAPHTGRGGWTWYTGSAGWLYRLIVESLLGIERIGDSLHLKPCLPSGWPSVELRYRYLDTLYVIVILRDPGLRGDALLMVDGIRCEGVALVMVDDHQMHAVELRIP